MHVAHIGGLALATTMALSCQVGRIRDTARGADERAYLPIPANERLVGVAYTTWHQSPDWHNVWGAPELGTYASTDRAVIRQHAEWLLDAGVDFVWIDWSNNIDYIPGVTQGRADFDTIEGATRLIFEEFASLERSPKVSIFLGCPGSPAAATDGRLTSKAEQVYDEFVANPRYRPLVQDYLGKPLLVIYVNTPSHWQEGLPDWDDPRFEVRFMTGYVTEQTNLRTDDLISRFGYWSWEDRGPQTFTVYEGRPEAMVVVAAWRQQAEPGQPGYIPPSGRRDGATFREQWTRVREIGPRFAMVTTWNEWVLGEQPSAELSRDIEPSVEFGHQYLDILREQVALFKAGD